MTQNKLESKKKHGVAKKASFFLDCLDVNIMKLGSWKEEGMKREDS